jgi:single-stranded-DNA-specific exonuclease
MEKNWEFKKQGDPIEIKHLSVALNVSMTLARLLVQRGITTFNEAKAFFPSAVERSSRSLPDERHGQSG